MQYSCFSSWITNSKDWVYTESPAVGRYYTCHLRKDVSPEQHLSHPSYTTERNKFNLKKCFNYPSGEIYSTCEGKGKATARQDPLHGLESVPQNSVWGAESQHKQLPLKNFYICLFQRRQIQHAIKSEAGISQERRRHRNSQWYLENSPLPGNHSLLVINTHL